MHFNRQRYTSTIAFYDANVQSASDYYAFGQLLPGRNTGENYRYGFNGMEEDTETKGEGNSYTTEFRQYDPRIGRWLTVDPLAHQAAGWTPYRAFFDNPMIYTDNDGLYETKRDARKAKREARQAGLETEKIYGSKGNYVFNASEKDGSHAVTYKNKTDFSSSNAENFKNDGVMESALVIGDREAKSSGGGLGMGLSVADVGAGAVNMMYNHDTYITTRGVEKNIYKANGVVRSARAAKYAGYSKLVKGLGTAASVASTAYSGYKVVSGTGNTMDKVDFGVGATGIISGIFSGAGIISNPVGWGIGIGASVYGAARLLGDVIGDYTPQGPGVGQWRDPSTGIYMIK